MDMGGNDDRTEYISLLGGSPPQCAGANADCS